MQPEKIRFVGWDSLTHLWCLNACFLRLYYFFPSQELYATEIVESCMCALLHRTKKEQRGGKNALCALIHKYIWGIITDHFCSNVRWLQSQILSITHVIEVFSLGHEVNRGGNHNLKLLHSFIRSQAAAWRGSRVKG